MGYLLWIVVIYTAYQTVKTDKCPGHTRSKDEHKKDLNANCIATCSITVNKNAYNYNGCILCKTIWLNDTSGNETRVTADEFRQEYMRNTTLECSSINRTSDFDEEKELSAQPMKGLMAGGTKITINKIFTNFNPIMEPMNKKCDRSAMGNGTSYCITPPSSSKKANLTFISDYVKYYVPFQYLENPIVSLKEPNSSYYWGKRQLQFQGKYLSHINTAELSYTDISEECTINDETLDCLSPRIINTTDHPQNSSKEFILVLKMDTFAKNILLTYHPDPKFEEKALMKNNRIKIKGEHLDEAADETEYRIVAKSENCTIKILESKFIECTLQDSEFEGSINVTLHSHTKTLEIIKIKNLLKILLIALSFFIVLLLIVLIVLYKIFYRKKKKRWFASTDDSSGQLMSVIVKHGIPFQKASNYIKRILWTHKPPGNIHYDTQNMSDNLKQILEDFELLLKNKYFLLPTLKALEKDKSLTQDHKFTYSYHLSLLFSSDLCYFLEFCEELFIHLVSQNKGSKSKKLMLRCSSITEYLILNWIGISMYSSMKDIGDILYFLNHDLKKYLEKMPTDEVTGDTYRCLFEKYKMMTRISYEEIKIQAELNGVIKTVPVFTCDTIVQLKKKCLEVFYQGKPVSEIPDIDDICVFDTTTRIDEFKREENSKGFTQHLTIDNWSIQSYNLLKLTFCQEQNAIEEEADDRYTTLGSLPARITTKSKRKFIHLQEPQCQKNEPLLTRKDLKKMNMPVNVENKLMQLMFKFLSYKNVPAPLCCLYNMFKKAANITGEEKKWFLNSYLIQFCCQFIAEPTILLDISQEAYMKKNQEGIKNYAIYLMERCSRNASVEPELDKNVTDFLLQLSNSKVDIQELMSSLQSISAAIMKDISFIKENSLYYLFKMMKTNYSIINSALIKDEKACRLQLNEKFLNIIEEIEFGQAKRREF